MGELISLANHQPRQAEWDDLSRAFTRRPSLLFRIERTIKKLAGEGQSLGVLLPQLERVGGYDEWGTLEIDAQDLGKCNAHEDFARRLTREGFGRIRSAEMVATSAMALGTANLWRKRLYPRRMDEVHRLAQTPALQPAIPGLWRPHDFMPENGAQSPAMVTHRLAAFMTLDALGMDKLALSGVSPAVPLPRHAASLYDPFSEDQCRQYLQTAQLGV